MLRTAAAVAATVAAPVALVAWAPPGVDLPPPRVLQAYVAVERQQSCPWWLVAAVGDHESDHGRYGGSSVDDDGVLTGAIVSSA